MKKLWHFEIIKIGQNLHVNMEGFRRAGHIRYAYKSHILVATATALPPELPPGTSHTSS